MSPFELVVVALAGLVAGMVNAMAGGGTLVSFPVLLGLGLPPVVANVTSAVGLSSGYLGAAIGYRRELVGQRSRILALGPFALVGGAAGAAILLVAPAAVFHLSAPYLVLLACGLMIAQPYLASRVRARSAARASAGSERKHRAVEAKIGVFLAGAYGAYFGAGLGVLLLAVLGILIEDSLQRLNALKAALSLVINVVGVGLFAFSGHVSWLAAGIVFVAASFGGVFGARVARVLPPAVLRWAVVVLGVVVAVVLLVQQHA